MPVTISGSLAGRRALVTGGSKGTGAAIAGRLTEAGATVMTTARTMPAGYPDPGLFVAADISTPGGVRRSSTGSASASASWTSWSTPSAARTGAPVASPHWPTGSGRTS